MAPGVETEAFSTTCTVYGEDCEGWWLPGGRSLVVIVAQWPEHWQLKPGAVVSIPGFTSSSIASKQTTIATIWSSRVQGKSEKSKRTFPYTVGKNLCQWYIHFSCRSVFSAGSSQDSIGEEKVAYTRTMTALANPQYIDIFPVLFCACSFA